MQHTMTSTKPYLLRALYEWIVDNELTPHVVVNTTRENVRVPRQYVKDGQIVLNINPGAIHALTIDNEWFFFDARFSGAPFAVSFPVDAVLGIFARENGQGMFFQEEETSAPEEDSGLPQLFEAKDMQHNNNDDDDKPNPPPPPRGKPVLKRVK